MQLIYFSLMTAVFKHIILFIIIGVCCNACAKLSILDFSIASESLTMHSGETTQLKVGISYSGVDTLALEFSSSDIEVADVDKYGNITAYQPGTTVITVACSDRSLECLVTVEPQICVVGYYTATNGRNSAFLYSDQQLSTISASDLDAKAYSAAFVGANVWSCGYVASTSDENAVPHAVYWNGSSAKTLNDGTTASIAYDIAASGDSAFVAGYVLDAQGLTNAYVWTPNTSTLLASGAEARTVCAIGSDVYVGGSIGNLPAIWVNNVSRILSDSQGVVTKIVVDGSDVYAVGSLAVNGITHAAFWKNEEISIISQEESSATGLTVYDGTATVCGNIGGRAFFWSPGGSIYKASEGTSYAGIVENKVGMMMCGTATSYDLQSGSIIKQAMLWHTETTVLGPDLPSSVATGILAR